MIIPATPIPIPCVQPGFSYIIVLESNSMIRVFQRNPAIPQSLTWNNHPSLGYDIALWKRAQPRDPQMIWVSKVNFSRFPNVGWYQTSQISSSQGQRFSVGQIGRSGFSRYREDQSPYNKHAVHLFQNTSPKSPSVKERIEFDHVWPMSSSVILASLPGCIFPGLATLVRQAAHFWTWKAGRHRHDCHQNRWDSSGRQAWPGMGHGLWPCLKTWIGFVFVERFPRVSRMWIPKISIHNLS